VTPGCLRGLEWRHGTTGSQNTPISAKKATSIRNVAVMMATVQNASPGENEFMSCLAHLRSPEALTGQFTDMAKVSISSGNPSLGSARSISETVGQPSTDTTTCTSQPRGKGALVMLPFI
jgi:hypothetical protein